MKGKARVSEIDEDFRELLKLYRDAIIAHNFESNTKEFRSEKHKNKKFYDAFEENENLRMIKFGTGVKIFKSNAEVIGRLMLLISSKEAGNVGVEIDNEIVDILDHLRSENLLTSYEYETLHLDLI